MAEGIVVVRRLGKRRQIGGLGQRQLVDRLVEIFERRGGDAIGAQPEEDLVQIELEDLVLRVGLLDAQRQDRFLDLAVDALLVGEQEVLRHLLGDRRGADRPLPDAIGLDVLDHGAEDAVIVEAGVVVEVLVFRRDEGRLDPVREWPGSAGRAAARAHIRRSAARPPHGCASSPAARIWPERRSPAGPWSDQRRTRRYHVATTKNNTAPIPNR